jgi:hypothetical protein
VAVEKGTKAVISVDFSVYSERTFNTLRTNFGVEFPGKEFFNSHGIFQQQSASACFIPDTALRRLLHKAELESINASVL